MSPLDLLLGGSDSHHVLEYEEFKANREYERDVFETALYDWIIRSGLGPIVLDQSERYLDTLDEDEWPDQFDMYKTSRFDPRNPEHREILEYLAREVERNSGGQIRLEIVDVEEDDR